MWRAHATTTTLQKRGSAWHGAPLSRIGADPRERSAMSIIRALTTPRNTEQLGTSVKTCIDTDITVKSDIRHRCVQLDFGTNSPSLTGPYDPVSFHVRRGDCASAG